MWLDSPGLRKVTESLKRRSRKAAVRRMGGPNTGPEKKPSGPAEKNIRGACARVVRGESELQN